MKDHRVSMRRSGRLAAALALALGLAACGGGQQDGGQPSPTATTSPSAEPSPSPTTPQEEASAALEQLVRGYEAAETAAFLDPTIDPSSAFEPYLRYPAADARVRAILDFRRDGNTVAERTMEVHSVEVTSLDLAASPATATVVACTSLTASGADGAGTPRSVAERRVLTTWTAKTIPNGMWRLYSFKGGSEDSC